MKENIEIVDRDYTGIKAVELSRPIKTRKASFSSILSNFKKDVLKIRLNMMQNKALYEKYESDMPYKKIQNKVTKDASAIARLEEKILFLSRDDIPENYVESRAIKIRDAMMANLTDNSKMVYSGTLFIGLENKNEIFGDFENDISDLPIVSDNGSLDNNDISINKVEDVVEPESVDEVTDNNDVLFEVNHSEESNLDGRDINVVPTDLERKNIEDAITEEFANISLDNNNNTFDSNNVISNENDNSDDNQITNFVSPEDVRNVVGDSVDNEIPVEEVKEVINSALEEVNNDNNELVGEDFIKNEIESAYNDIKVSHNNSSAARLNHFDEDGNAIFHDNDLTDEDEVKGEIENVINGIINDRNNVESSQTISGEEVVEKIQDAVADNENTTDIVVDRDAIKDEVKRVLAQERNKRSGYEPLSDDEVKDIQNKLEIENNQSMNSDIAVRDVPIVVPDRVKSYDNIISKDSESIENISSPNVSKQDQIDSYSELKKRLESLMKHQKATEQAKNAAQKAAEDMAEKAKEARELAQRTEKVRAEQLERLRSYTEMLEKSCKDNEKSIELAENDAIMNNNFIEEQLRKVEENNNVIDEIDELIGNKVR